MPERNLQEILDELQQRLERSPELDPESRAALGEAAAEILAALAREEQEPFGEGLRERLTAAIARFEGQHPKLTESVKRLVDQLAEMGI